MVLISKDNLLNKAHVKYLENKFYSLAKEANRFKVLNATIPTLSSISKYDVAMLNEYIYHAKLLVNTLSYKVFEPIASSQAEGSSNEDHFVILSARGADAKGNLVSDGFAVFKGSSIANLTVPSMPPSLVKLREDLIQNGIIDNQFRFVKDYLFTSPSLAAAIVMSRNANGRTEWKTVSGLSIKDLEAL